MNQSDYCQCGGQKAVVVTTIDGQIDYVFPGSSVYLPMPSVDRLECACSVCGLLYSLHSLSSPVQINE